MTSAATCTLSPTSFPRRNIAVPIFTMTAQPGLEPFPPLNVSHNFVRRESHSHKHGDSSRRRRKSSGLGGELPGDSDVAAFATLAQSSPPLTPSDMSRPSDKPGRRSKRRTLRRALSKAKRICIRHTWVGPLVLGLTVISLYLIYPYPSNPVSAALFLSYEIPQPPGSTGPIQYGKGARDFAFVGFYIILLSFTREFIMQRILRPLALHYGIKSRAKQARFMEQYYTAIYFAFLGPFGMWVMSRTPIWYFNTRAMYEGFPHRTHDAAFKAYYLVQASYWAQQMIVLMLMLEKPRKDFKELVAHHFITLSLIWLSYRFHFTYMGLAVYITHDVSDFFLATSKVLNYIDSSIVGPYFFIFMCVWGYLRHFINLRILTSIITQMPYIGPFELNWETQQYKCTLAQYITFSLLAALQAVNIFWSFLILRIAWRFVKSWGEDELEDDRSEYGESDLEDEFEYQERKERQAVHMEDIKEERESSESPQAKAKANGAAKLNGSANGKVNGTAKPNGTPKVTVNGRTPNPSPSVASGAEPRSSSRIQARKGGN
ncbi:TLC domain-domain-containing protein [Clohesyomyces aquaticus]|uniref:TLC domain-domain-containing protein n=1 Tax=Clohesyomyces aquaticus TaxID=1231657 RepID=A0A1Y1Y3H8_9PLEO|nr:TLC domain-domain-containing protein [Clohesyomyces aquaticus]